MGGLSYITLTRFKNQIKSIFRSPAKIIYLVLFSALLVFMLYTGSRPVGEDHVTRDIDELLGMVVAMLLLMFMILVNNGFSTGASLFKMPDVNFVFTGPFRPNRVLFYGLFQQLGNSLLMGAFILFQYSWMRNVYGVGFGSVLLILAAYALCVFSAQLVALLIYSFTAGNEKLRLAFRIAYAAIPAAYALGILITLVGTQDIIASLADFAGSLPMRLFPIAGWIGGAVAGVLLGKPAFVILGLGIWIVVMTALVTTVIFSKHDYYEFVLQSTETSHATQAAAREGKLLEQAPKNLRVGKEGLGGGFGASAFYYKHKLENRRSRKFILSGMSLMFCVCVIGFTFFVRGVGLVPVISFAAYVQIFSVALGRLVRELTKPYVYLVPEPAFKKLLWCLGESFFSYIIEAVIIFIPVCLILGLHLPEMIACVIVRLSFSYLFVAGNLVSERIFGHITTKGLIIFFFIIVMIVLCAPGIVLSIVLSTVGIVFISGEVTLCLAMTVLNVPIALLVIFLCRNILDIAELRG